MQWPTGNTKKNVDGSSTCTHLLQFSQCHIHPHGGTEHRHDLRVGPPGSLVETEIQSNEELWPRNLLWGLGGKWEMEEGLEDMIFKLSNGTQFTQFGVATKKQ